MFSHAVTEIGSTTPQLLAEVGGMLLALGIAAFIAAKLKFSVVPVFLLISLLLDWGVVGAVALGGITYVSSSGIAAQLTKEMGFMRSEVLKRASGILVFEDLALAPYPPLLTSLVPGVSAFSGLISVAAALVITGLILTVFGTALLAAGLADMIGFSGVVAAFLIGLLLTGEVAETARAKLSPIRDIFAAIFFVFFGLATNPADLPAVIPLAVVLTVIRVVGKMFTGWWVTRDLTDKSSLKRAGVFLVPRGEFLLVFAALASPGVTIVNLQALTLAYVILSSMVASFMLWLARSPQDQGSQKSSRIGFCWQKSE